MLRQVGQLRPSDESSSASNSALWLVETTDDERVSSAPLLPCVVTDLGGGDDGDDVLPLSSAACTLALAAFENSAANDDAPRVNTAADVVCRSSLPRLRRRPLFGLSLAARSRSACTGAAGAASLARRRARLDRMRSDGELLADMR